MNSDDETELHRLCDELRLIEQDQNLTVSGREAVEKAAIALSLVFITKKRPEMEHLYQSLAGPVTEAQESQLRAHLRAMGIEPEEDDQ